MTAALRKVLKNKIYLRVMIVLFFSESGANAYYWGANYAYDQIGYEFGTNCIISGIIEAFGFVTLSNYRVNLGIFIERLPRKKSVFVLYLTMIGIGCLFFIKFFQDNDIVASVVLGVIRYLGSTFFPIQLWLFCLWLCS
jgi:hypothetical protein